MLVRALACGAGPVVRAEVGIVRGGVVCDRRHPAGKHSRSTLLMGEALEKHEHGLLQNTGLHTFAGGTGCMPRSGRFFLLFGGMFME